jgi:hypothetical protein
MTKKTPEELALDAYLAGLTEKKVRVSDNYIIAANNRTVDHYIGSMTDPDVRKAIEEKRKEGMERAKQEGKFSTGLKNRYKKDSERKKTSLIMKKVHENLTEEEKNRRNEASRKKWADPKVKKQASESHKRQWADPEKRKRLGATMKAIRQTPIMTPDGPFPDTTSAGEHYGLTSATILYRRKKYPKEYYYITKEEYIMLTGKEL